MSHAIHRVEHFEIVGPYTLALSFADGSAQRIDFRPVLEGEVFVSGVPRPPVSQNYS